MKLFESGIKVYVGSDDGIFYQHLRNKNTSDGALYKALKAITIKGGEIGDVEIGHQTSLPLYVEVYFSDSKDYTPESLAEIKRQIAAQIHKHTTRKVKL